MRSDFPLLSGARLKLLLSDQLLVQMGLPTLGLALGPKEALFFAAFPFSSLRTGLIRILNGVAALFTNSIEQAG